MIPPGEHDFEVLYNCGVSYLTRANAIARQKEAGQSELNRLLSIACQRFTEAIQIQPKSINAFHNLAVSTAKRARTLEDAEAQHAEYLQSFQLYQTAYQLAPQNENLLFDWGNALYRHAMSRQFKAMGSSDIFLMLQESFEKYHAALQIEPVFEASFINLSLVLTSLLSVPSASEPNQQQILACNNKYTDTVKLFFTKRSKITRTFISKKKLTTTQKAKRKPKILQYVL